MSLIESAMERFEGFSRKVIRHERIAGIYILDAVAVPNEAQDAHQRELFLRTFATRHGFSGPELNDQHWRHFKVSREEAREAIVQVVAGGAEIGHGRWDVPPDTAEILADEFLGLFCDDGWFFCDRPADSVHPSLPRVLTPYARPDFYDYIFGGGCLAVDSQLAAVFWVLDSD